MVKKMLNEIHNIISLIPKDVYLSSIIIIGICFIIWVLSAFAIKYNKSRTEIIKEEQKINCKKIELEQETNFKIATLEQESKNLRNDAMIKSHELINKAVENNTIVLNNNCQIIEKFGNKLCNIESKLIANEVKV